MSNKHNPDDLRQMQMLSLQSKIIMTQQRIRQWYDYWNGDVYVSFSGGKDSTVLKHIVDGMTEAGSIGSVPAVFVNTGLEYPELQNFVREIKAGKYECFNSDVEIIRPEMRFDEVIKNYGYPVISKVVSKKIKEARNAYENGKDNAVCVQQMEDRFLTPDGKKSKFNYGKWRFLIESQFKISHQCCDVMKKKPAQKYIKSTNRKPLIATLASESMLRYTKWLQRGCNAFEGKSPSSQPLSFWTENDILHYLKKYNVPYCSVYGDIVIDDNAEIEGQINLIDYVGEYEENDKLKTTGCDRTGCMFCMFGCHLEKGENRFQRLKRTHPRQYDFCINGGGIYGRKVATKQKGFRTCKSA